MFKPVKNDSGRSVGNLATIVAAGTRIEGSLHSTTDVRIDGTICGHVSGSGKVIVGAEGWVDGPMHCRHADIMGKVTGNLVASESIIIRKGAQVEGNIETPALELESSARFNGNCSMQHPEIDQAREVAPRPKKQTPQLAEDALMA